MNKKVLAFIFVLVVILFFGLNYKKAPSTGYFNNSTSDIILFYGEGCPHCENVDKFIKENNVTEKVKFQNLEVFNNEANSRLLSEKASACKMTGESVPVPFLWDGQKCITGDVDVIDFFKNKIK